MRLGGGSLNLVLNLDMHKAYDHMEWDFLLEVLLRFVFAPAWINLGRACISDCHYLIIFQGQVRGFFASSRGLQQGGPSFPESFHPCEGCSLSCPQQGD